MCRAGSEAWLSLPRARGGAGALTAGDAVGDPGDCLPLPPPRRPRQTPAPAPPRFLRGIMVPGGEDASPRGRLAVKEGIPASVSLKVGVGTPSALTVSKARGPGGRDPAQAGKVGSGRGGGGVPYARPAGVRPGLHGQGPARPTWMPGGGGAKIGGGASVRTRGGANVGGGASARDGGGARTEGGVSVPTGGGANTGGGARTEGGVSVGRGRGQCRGRGPPAFPPDARAPGKMEAPRRPRLRLSRRRLPSGDG